MEFSSLWYDCAHFGSQNNSIQFPRNSSFREIVTQSITKVKSAEHNWNKTITKRVHLVLFINKEKMKWEAKHNWKNRINSQLQIVGSGLQFSLYSMHFHCSSTFQEDHYDDCCWQRVSEWHLRAIGFQFHPRSCLIDSESREKIILRQLHPNPWSEKKMSNICL